MAETQPSIEALLARVTAAVNAATIVLRVLRYGFSTEVHERPRLDIFDRSSGSMALRFLLPLGMAAIGELAAHLSCRRRGSASGTVR